MFDMRIMFEFEPVNTFSNERERAKDWRRITKSIDEAVIYVIEPFDIEAVDFIPKSSWMEQYLFLEEEEERLLLDITFDLSHILNYTFENFHAARGLNLRIKNSDGEYDLSDCFTADYLYRKIVCVNLNISRTIEDHWVSLEFEG